ncbi:MAG: outer membrane beta-barrel protein [Aquificae bacterium]|nr:outer membrane beta-barrel protein [Aquificota bacterium]
MGLKKDADANSPIGFNAAFASFEAPTLVASSDVVNHAQLIKHGETTDFMPWLAYITIAPMEDLSIDAGLLWNKFGEAPLTILNRHYNRGILFTGHPVAYAGARANYDAGIVQVYAGYNQGGGLRQGDDASLGYDPADAFEAGITFNLSDFVGFGSAVSLHTYDEAKGRNLYVLCTKVDLGIVKAGIEFDYTTLDDEAKRSNENATHNPLGYDQKADDAAWGIAFNIDVDFLNAQIANVTVPIRIEYVDNGDSSDETGSGIYLTGKNSAWSFTITPTWKPTANTFARIEYAYISTSKKVFVDDTGNKKDNRTSLAFEAGFLF